MKMWILLFLGACLSFECAPQEESQADEETTAIPVVDVRIDSVRAGSISETLHANGSLQALRRENLRSPVDGEVTSLEVLDGDPVRCDAVIARIRTQESLSALRGARELLARAQTPEEKARATVDLERARRNETQLDIVAPYDGVIASRSVNDGEYVQAGESVVTVFDPKSLCFVARVPARHAWRLRRGLEARLHLEAIPGATWRCEVENIKPQVEPLSQQAEVRLRIVDPAEAFGAAQFGSVDFVVGRHENVLIVPKAAVLRDDETGSHTVVEALGDSVAVVRAVHIVLENSDQVEIEGDVHRGMHVIIEGHYGLPDSTRIHVLPAQGSEASSPVPPAPPPTPVQESER